MFALRAAARTVAHKRPFFSLAYSALQEEAQKLPYQLTAPPPALRCVTSTKSGADARLLGEELGRDLVDRLGGAARVAVVVVASRAVGDVVDGLRGAATPDAVVGAATPREAFATKKTGEVVAAATAVELPERAAAVAFASEAGGLPDFDAARPGAWEAYATGPAPELLLLAAAPRGALDAWLRRMDVVLPGSTKLGGVLEDESGELVAGDAFAAERVREGVCGIALEGVRLDAAVAAGPTLATLRGPRVVTSARPVDGGVAITGLDGDEETCCARSLGAGGSAGDLEGLLVGVVADARAPLGVEPVSLRRPLGVEDGALKVACDPQLARTPGSPRRAPRSEKTTAASVGRARPRQGRALPRRRPRPPRARAARGLRAAAPRVRRQGRDDARVRGHARAVRGRRGAGLPLPRRDVPRRHRAGPRRRRHRRPHAGHRRRLPVHGRRRVEPRPRRPSLRPFFCTLVITLLEDGAEQRRAVAEQRAVPRGGAGSGWVRLCDPDWETYFYRGDPSLPSIDYVVEPHD